jgi:predicted nuclease of predicted toxin-antitoxin system
MLFFVKRAERKVGTVGVNMTSITGYKRALRCVMGVIIMGAPTIMIGSTGHLGMSVTASISTTLVFVLFMLCTYYEPLIDAFFPEDEWLNEAADIRIATAASSDPDTCSAATAAFHDLSLKLGRSPSMIIVNATCQHDGNHSKAFDPPEDLGYPIHTSMHAPWYLPYPKFSQLFSTSPLNPR